MEPARRLIAVLASTCLLLASGSAEEPEPRAGIASLERATKLLERGNAEESRVFVERAIAEMLAARPEAIDAEDDRALRDAGALAYKLRSMEPARRAWDAVRRHRERTLAPTSRELQNARGNVSWIGEQIGLVAEARELEEQILAALVATLPNDADELQMARANLADTLLQQGVFRRAADLFQQVVEVRRAKLPDGHPQRLRAELDRASGFLATNEPEPAFGLLTRIESECPRELSAIRLRWAAEEAWLSCSEPALTSTTAAYLASEIASSRKQIRALGWREAEARAAELGPFLDLLISVRGWPAEPTEHGLLEATLDAVCPVTPIPAFAVYRRFERSTVEGRGADRRVVADERLGVGARLSAGPSTWIDLGPLASARSLVQAWSDAARSGDAHEERDAVASALFAPVAKALGNAATIVIEPDDVIWAVPLCALGLRDASGREIAFEALVQGPRIAGPTPTGPWSVIGAGDPAAEVAGPGGAAASYVAGAAPSSKESTTTWARALGVEPVGGADASFARFLALSSASAGTLLNAPIWSAPDSVPCIASRRPIVASTPLAAAMAREDVFGGSSPADLCGFLLAGCARAPSEDARVAGAPRAADVREIEPVARGRLVVASSPPSADVVRRARDLEALARALVAAGFADVCLATGPIADVGRAALPADFGLATETAARGPWLRVRSRP